MLQAEQLCARNACSCRHPRPRRHGLSHRYHSIRGNEVLLLSVKTLSEISPCRACFQPCFVVSQVDKTLSVARLSLSLLSGGNSNSGNIGSGSGGGRVTVELNPQVHTVGDLRRVVAHEWANTTTARQSDRSSSGGGGMGGDALSGGAVSRETVSWEMVAGYPPTVLGEAGDERTLEEAGLSGNTRVSMRAVADTPQTSGR